MSKINGTELGKRGGEEERREGGEGERRKRKRYYPSASLSMEMERVQLFSIAYCRGVKFFMHFFAAFAPHARRRSTTGLPCAHEAAKCSAVLPIMEANVTKRSKFCFIYF